MRVLDPMVKRVLRGVTIGSFVRVKPRGMMSRVLVAKGIV